MSGTYLKANPLTNPTDFVIDINEDREPVILHISDPQLVDSTKQRYGGRLDSIQYNYWTPDKLDENCFDRLPHWEDALKRYLLSEC